MNHKTQPCFVCHHASISDGCKIFVEISNKITTDLTFWPFNIALEMTIIGCIFINPGTLTKQTALPKYSWKKEVCDGT